jgi:hypothetical protein
MDRGNNDIIDKMGKLEQVVEEACQTRASIEAKVDGLNS